MQVLELIEKARSGCKESQKQLFNNCKMISLPITLQYLKRGIEVGLNYEDLRNLNVKAFYKVLEKFDKERQEFNNYYKYIYMMTIKDEIRNEWLKLKRRKEEYILDNENYNDSSIQFNSSSFEETEEKYSSYDKAKIYDVIVNKNLVRLTRVEYENIKYFLDGFTIKEIADLRERNYSDTFKSIKKATSKIRNYFIRT